MLQERTFGCGSSREQAPEIIKALGVQCVIAKSFARIFFRNSINNGLLFIEQPTLYDDIKEGDTISVVMNEHVDYNGKTYPIASLPENLMEHYPRRRSGKGYAQTEWSGLRKRSEVCKKWERQ